MRVRQGCKTVLPILLGARASSRQWLLDLAPKLSMWCILFRRYRSGFPKRRQKRQGYSWDGSKLSGRVGSDRVTYDRVKIQRPPDPT